MVSKEVIEALRDLDTEIGEGWLRHAKEANATDDLLYVPIADGIFDTKIDGWIHAGNLTAKSLAKYATNPDSGLDIEEATSWSGGNPAIRFGRSQADFHWEIDTRMWQYFLYLAFMRRSIRDAIQRANEITGDEEAKLLRANNEYWDEVVVQYAYRTEIIERTRGFAEHPDQSAGSNRYGYEYEVAWDRDDWSEYALDALDLDVDPELIEDDLEERGVSSTSDVHVPDPFPTVEKDLETGLEEAAKRWVDAAKRSELADEYLRVVMGSGDDQRWIPTRYAGWKTSIENVTLPYLKEYASSSSTDHGEYEGFGLNDPAVRFGLCQGEFQRRFEGTRDQLVEYLETQQQGINYLIEVDAMIDVTPEDVETFFDTVRDTVDAFFDRSLELDGDDLTDVTDERPIHPRFAPYDPEEPLPWNTDDPEKHQKIMEIRGFTI